MKKINLTFDRYKKSIAEIEESNLKKIVNLRKGIQLSRECLSKFSSIIRSSNFPSDEAEITFFKYQKPYIEGRLKYFKKLHQYLLEQPISGMSKLRKFVSNELNKLDTQKGKQFEFVKYYRLEEDKLDHIYFLRGNDQLELFNDNSNHFKDPEFTTSHDYYVSKIIAHDLLIIFFSKELELLKKKETNIIIEEVKPKIFNDLMWTGTKTELIELIFALNACGCFRNGNADIKKIVKVCEELFNLDLGNIRKTYDQIKARKKDSTKFLDKLAVSLSNEIAFEA